MWTFSTSVWMPPTPEPHRTPARAASPSERSIVNPASSMASFATATANCAKRSVRRASFRSRNFSGSNPFTSPAIFVSSALASKVVIGPMPERPARRACHVVGVSLPTGVIMPMPVTTTRLRFPSPTTSKSSEKDGGDDREREAGRDERIHTKCGEFVGEGRRGGRTARAERAPLVLGGTAAVTAGARVRLQPVLRTEVEHVLAGRRDIIDAGSPGAERSGRWDLRTDADADDRREGALQNDGNG